MHKNDETTSSKIEKKLAEHEICLSPSTVQRSREQRGWTLQWTTYCQLIWDANKVKRLEFTQDVLESGDTFHNVIFSKECLISLQLFRCTCSRMVDEPTKWKLKPKHLPKVHVWEGISRHGAIKICIQNVIFSEECSISLQSYRRTCFRMVDEPIKVHVWEGISRHGATKICIFDGIMAADLFCNFLTTSSCKTTIPNTSKSRLWEGKY